MVGGGLIGGAAAIELASAGHPTTVFSRSFGPLLAAKKSSLPLTLVEGALPPAGQLEELIAGARSVLFLAGSSTPLLSDQDAPRSIAKMLEPALSVLDAMRHTGTRRLVIASSGGTVYGRVAETPTPEDAPTQPISVHGVNSLATEQYVELYAREYGLEPAILRFSNVYGPGQRVHHGFGVIVAWCEALAAGEPAQVVGDGGIRRDFVHAADAGRAAALALDAPPGTYNVGSGESVSLSELLELLSEVSAVDPEVTRLPARPVDVPVTQLDSSRLREATGWSPRVSLREGLEECWRWAQDKERMASTTRSP